MQYVAFNIGNEVLCMSRPSPPEASQTLQDICELRLDKVNLPATQTFIVPTLLPMMGGANGAVCPHQTWRGERGEWWGPSSSLHLLC